MTSMESPRPATATTGQVLLDAGSTFRRVMQLGIVGLGVVVLAFAGIMIRKAGVTPFGLTAMALGFAFLALGPLVLVRWDVTYKGHRLRFQNDPYRGERLFLDGRLVGKGTRGRDLTIIARIPDGEGAGEEVVSTSVAGLLTFRCRIVARPDPSQGGV